MKVSKYNASGNDFIVFKSTFKVDRSALARLLCDRKNGVGADGLIVIEQIGENAIKWGFYNSDGSRAEMCGNGSRAAFLFAYKNGLIAQNATLQTQAGIINGKIFDKNLAKNELEKANFIPSENSQNLDESHIAKNIVEVELTSPKILAQTPIFEFGRQWYFYDTGVPHLVSYCQNLDDFNANFDLQMARGLRHKHNANVNFALIKDGLLFVRTYERGVEDETLACGTGMAACFYGGVLSFNLTDNVKVYPKSGEELGLRLENGKILFSGAVAHCFDAKFCLANFLSKQEMKNMLVNFTQEIVQKSPDLRYGQALFNAASELFPSATDRLRTSEFDCFYTDERAEKFLEKLTQIAVQN